MCKGITRVNKGGYDEYRDRVEYHQGDCDEYRDSLSTTRQTVMSIWMV